MANVKGIRLLSKIFLNSDKKCVYSFLFFLAFTISIFPPLGCNTVVYFPPPHYFNTLSEGKIVDVRPEIMIAIPSATITLRHEDFFAFKMGESGIGGDNGLNYRFGVGGGKIFAEDKRKKDKWSPKTLMQLSGAVYSFRLKEGINNKTVFIDGVEFVGTYNFVFTSDFFDAYAGADILFVVPFPTRPFIDSIISAGAGFGYKSVKVMLRLDSVWTTLLYSAIGAEKIYPTIEGKTMIPFFFAPRVGFHFVF